MTIHDTSTYITPSGVQSDSAASLSGVTVEFRDIVTGATTTVLDGLDLECRREELLVIVGPSGCGKTTVLNLLAGLVDQQAGTVLVGGRAPRAARDELGYMFARDALIPSRTALGNVEVGLEVRGVPRKERRERARGLLATLGLVDAERRYPWQLSQGMRQRVALARTWALDPRLILMDEPFAALDAQTRESMREEFLSLWERTRSGIVLVTHDLTEALLMGDRVVIMGARGRIAGDFSLPFGRPRDPSTLPYTDEFRDLERTLHGLLHETQADISHRLTKALSLPGSSQ
ncbi:ABC transporter ATP-binding protein [Rhodococcus sp. WS4]|nr:ABC transporter ATP-binding protein [Rhodococcus sp. WS4]